MKKKLDTTKTMLLAVSVLSVIVIVFSGIMIVKYFKDYGSFKPVISKYSTSLYQLPTNPNDYQISIYEELSKICNEFDQEEGKPTKQQFEKLAPAVVKSFIADFFTWGNKRGSYDVGGMDYVFGPTHANTALRARENYYQDLDILIKEYQTENLPTVKNITINGVSAADPYVWTSVAMDWEKNESYLVDTTFEDVFIVQASWEYSLPEGSTFDTSELPTSGEFKLLYSNNRLEIAYYHED